MILIHGDLMDIGHGVNVFTMDMLVKVKGFRMSPTSWIMIVGK